MYIYLYIYIYILYTVVMHVSYCNRHYILSKSVLSYLCTWMSIVCFASLYGSSHSRQTQYYTAPHTKRQLLTARHSSLQRWSLMYNTHSLRPLHLQFTVESIDIECLYWMLIVLCWYVQNIFFSRLRPTNTHQCAPFRSFIFPFSG